MFRKGYVIRDQQAVYYMTFTVVGWIDVFTRQQYRDLVIESLKYCQQKKGLHLHAYVIMSNHVHLIASVDEGFTLSEFVRDSKKFIAKRIIDDILVNNLESRREWMLHQFKYYASRHSRNENYQLWEHENHFVELFSPAFMQQKIDYIHQTLSGPGWCTGPKTMCIQAHPTTQASTVLLMLNVYFRHPVVRDYLHSGSKSETSNSSLFFFYSTCSKTTG